MHFIIHAAFAFTLTAFVTGLIAPVRDARLDGMRAEFAALHPMAPSLRPAWH